MSSTVLQLILENSVKGKKYSLKTVDNEPNALYLELSDLSEASIQIWEDEGQKKTFVRIKLTNEEMEKIVNEYEHIQTL